MIFSIISSEVHQTIFVSLIYIKVIKSRCVQLGLFALKLKLDKQNLEMLVLKLRKSQEKFVVSLNTYSKKTDLFPDFYPKGLK